MEQQIKQYVTKGNLNLTCKSMYMDLLILIGLEMLTGEGRLGEGQLADMCSRYSVGKSVG